MPDSPLVLGPLLRYVGATDATVWVETARSCEVEVLGCTARTFEVSGHHYAIVHVTGLAAGTETPYEVRLDGERVWPYLEDWPASTIRTIDPDAPQTICFGSCRVGVPHEEPHTLTKDEHPEGRETDALLALALRMRETDRDEWPSLLLMLGDQVYADEASPGVREFIEARRDPEVPPHHQVSDFEEYTRLYLESWGREDVRWLLSVVPTAMIFDDHDVIDDWNTSRSWIRDIRSNGWWDRRIVGGFMSYWVYQHAGNLEPEHLATDDTWRDIQDCEGDAAEMLGDFAWWADREVAGTRWSFARDVGRTRVVMIDSRAGRVLTPGERSMVDEAEWDWIGEHVTGDVDHLLIGTSLPLFLVQGLHWLEAFDEAISDGAWGPFGCWLGEKLRRAADLEHWAAFGDAFRRMAGLLDDVSAGRRGGMPASVAVLSGDVHHAYLAEVGFEIGSHPGRRAPVWQAVCSPFRNPLSKKERRAIKFAASPLAAGIARGLSRLAGVGPSPVGWRLTHDEPFFDNQVATIHFQGRSARLGIEKVEAGKTHLDEVFSATLA
jgi:hypothetical protein